MKFLEKGEQIHHVAHALKIGVDSAVKLSEEVRKHKRERDERKKETRSQYA